VVLSHLHFFGVPKGENDIGVVYNGTVSRLNDSLWCPNFYVPTARNASELLSFKSWMSDMDFSEFFYNFHIDEWIQKHSGIDVNVVCCPSSRGIVHEALPLMGPACHGHEA
jgi:hypothetical protein